ncbi:MAG: saccharopine dehydrogenase family protein [Planctomycetota bacterium]|jgi:saccharopine dehydrogenase-like NADP-dependent oxidoreductase
MPHAVVLGAGMVGSVVAADLAGDPEFKVTVADADRAALDAARGRTGDLITVAQADLSHAGTIKGIVAGADVVIGALPGSLGRGALEAVIEAGRNCCDISFMAEDALELDGLARDRGVTAVVDCGVAPGLSNMLAGYAAATLQPCARIAIYVGGLPRDPQPPLNYKTAFSPADVIEEYTRPARLVERGQVVVREALSEVEPIEFAGVGALEAFNTDGLRSLIRTLEVPDMVEKTVRYPGHAELMRAFREVGLFGREPVSAGGTTVRPIDAARALLFPSWRYEPGEEDLTVLRVVAAGGGESGGGLAWEMIDLYDRGSATSSMGRTTAFPCAITARLIADGRLADPGVIPPEKIGERPELLEHVLRELETRGVMVQACPQ